ncbi:hypothetical protein QPK13_10360 [Photorhabdus tasmaniensis]
MSNLIIGLDIAKNVFQVHGTDPRGMTPFDGNYVEIMYLSSFRLSIMHLSELKPVIVHIIGDES